MNAHDTTDPRHIVSAKAEAASGSHSPSHDAAFARRVLEARRAKDEYFARTGGPIPHDRLADFVGLAYFAPDVSFRVAAFTFEPTTELARSPISTSDGRQRTAYRLGRLHFELAGRELALTAYQVGEQEADSLFVPFRDGTSGRETYGAGRYLDIEPEADGTRVIDFNGAYQPYCAYSDAFSCPLPPAENWLPVRITAGERLGTIYVPPVSRTGAVMPDGYDVSGSRRTGEV